jgi:hypothetical protein
VIFPASKVFRKKLKEKEGDSKPFLISGGILGGVGI